MSYFRSGWAFLIPYLAAYLLYAWLKWPVNPASGGEGLVKVISESAGALPSTALSSPPFTFTLTSLVPCLLHVYWFLHAVNLILGTFALRAWWLGSTVLRSPFSVLQTAAPWILLGLLFWIPGVYLEFPSDPWSHYDRVNEWSSLKLVTQHSAWAKSSYFLAYSLIGHVTPPLRQLQWFDVYYTACCLLLCWQYYRLAHAIGLGKRTAMIFVILQSLLMGNNLFGFYRYYGMSSTVFAQLGAVALIRVVLVALRVSPQQASRERQLSTIPALSSKTLATDDPRYFLPQCASALALVALTAFNHVQGLGIAALGIAAVVVWRLIEWRCTMIWWLAVGSIILSIATVLWFPRHSTLDEVYRSRDWLTTWYGFNLFQPSSPAFDRAVEILGAAGLLNLFVGFWLLRRNHVAAWLTLMPVIALCLPVVAIPFSQQLIHSNQQALVFHRVLFALPAGLALVAFGACIIKREQRTPSKESDDTPQFNPPARSGLEPVRQNFYGGGSAAVTLSSPNGRTQGLGFPFCLISLAVCALILAPANSPSFSRLYNTLMRPPADLNMHHVLEAMESLAFKPAHLGPYPRLIAATGISFVAYSTGFKNVPTYHNRSIYESPLSKAAQAQSGLVSSAQNNTPAIFLLQLTDELYTPLSLTAHLSRNWQSHEVAFNHSIAPEAERMARELGYRKIKIGRFIYYFYPTN